MNISTPLALLVTENKSIINKGKDKDLTALPFEDFFKSNALCSLALATRVRGSNRGNICKDYLLSATNHRRRYARPSEKVATDEGLRLAFEPTFDKRCLI